MSFVTRRKPVEVARREGTGLKATLGWPHLVALGVGAIIGTGIYTLTGVAAGLAGPAVILSFAVAGAVCACAALCYAEMASLTPQAGSAYTYSYVTLGEMIAWVIGWSLILEYTLVCSASPEPQLVVFYMGVPDTAPELDRERLEQYFEIRFKQLAGQK